MPRRDSGARSDRESRHRQCAEHSVLAPCSGLLCPVRMAGLYAKLATYVLVAYAYFLLWLLPAATWVEDHKRHRRRRQQRQQSVFTELRVSVPLGKRMVLDGENRWLRFSRHLCMHA